MYNLGYICPRLSFFRNQKSVSPKKTIAINDSRDILDSLYGIGRSIYCWLVATTISSMMENFRKRYVKDITLLIFVKFDFFMERFLNKLH
mmetsp:Transcript_26726/g.39830  ORF Transcript_26726/g.39830 Transcript_26726/m.39830 type:complete len:90 (-) Transcript_26726:1384-1653(-)